MRSAITCLLAVSILFTLTACGGGGRGSGSQDETVLGSTFAAVGSYGGTESGIAGLIYYLVREFDQNQLDLNQDGDTGDDIMHVLNPATGLATNLMLPGSTGAVGNAARAVFAVSELQHFSMDRNGDGDLADFVIATYDPTLPVSLTNPTITTRTITQGSFLFSDGDFVFFLTRETEQGMTDLNGDGDATDDLISILDLATGNVQTVMQPWRGGSLNALNGWLLYVSAEADLGPLGTDHTGDGDATDVAVFMRRLSDGMTLTVPNTALAATNGIAGLLGTSLDPIVVYIVDEAGATPAVSLNGQFSDADVADEIVAVWNVNSGVVTLPMGGVAVDGATLAGSEDRLFFAATESGNGTGIDLNGDGDTADRIPYWVDLQFPAVTFGLGVAMATTSQAPGPQVCGHVGLFLASEQDQGATGTNFNASALDSDTSDNVAFAILMEGANTQAFNTGLATTQILCFEGENFFFLTSSESDQGGVDLNGDGDTGDLVPIMFTLQPNGTFLRAQDGVNIDGPIAFQPCAEFIRIWGNAKESNIYGDINEDGDIDDYGIVVTRISRGEGKILSFKPISTSDADGTAAPRVLDENTVLFPMVESMFAQGLNGNAPSGDSDVSDTILMYVRTFCF